MQHELDGDLGVGEPKRAQDLLHGVHMFPARCAMPPCKNMLVKSVSHTVGLQGVALM